MRRRALVLLGFALGVLLALVVSAQVSADTPIGETKQGDGSVRQNRMPFLSTESQMFLTQGWNSTVSSGTHEFPQYATDWAKAGNVTFAIYAAREGNATCGNFNDGFGNRVDVTRTDGKVDRYAHLPSCTFSTAHLEQGSFVSMSGDTGGDYVVHLHFEVFSSGGTSISHNLSQFFNWDDVTKHRNPSHHHHPAVADNAGPGVNLAGNMSAWLKIKAAYQDKGHFLCGANKAWNCFGSSKDYLNSGFPAKRSCVGSPVDCGWNQEFRAAAGEYHNFNWPEACPNAYWIPDGFFIARAANPWLGMARDRVQFGPFGWYQQFRYGIMFSSEFGGTPYLIIHADVVPCGPS